MRIAVAVIAIFAARLFMTAWFDPLHDGDLSWQQWLGAYILHNHHIPLHLGRETFTAPGARWIPQEWAFSVAVALANRAGHFAILAISVTAAAAGALLLTAYRAYRRGASTVATAVCTAFTGFAMLQAFGVRAQILGWLLLALLLLLLDIEGEWAFLAIPIVALWANLHASALIAPVIVFAWSLGTWIEDRAWTPRVERNAVVTAGCALAVFLTPLLWHLPLYAIHLQSSSIRSSIAEWQPPDLFFPAYSAGLLPLIGLACYFGIAAPRERWRDGMLFGVAALIGGMAMRHVPLAALLVAPMAAQRLSNAIPEHARINAVIRERFSQALIFTSAALVCGVIIFSLAQKPEISGETLPQGAIAALGRVPGTHNLYCEDFAWCGLALEEPNVRTFLDGRCDPFPPAVWRDYLAVERVTPGFSRVLARRRVDAVIVKSNDALAQAMSSRRGWHVFYRQGRYEVFLHDGIRTAER